VQDRGPAAYLAEFIGTFMLVFMITAAVTLYVVPPSPQVPIQPFIDFSVIGLVHVFALFMLIQTLAVVSGAHFNPAITIALAAIRQIKPPDALIYVVVQIAGGILGALLTKALLSDEGEAVSYGATLVSARLDGENFPGLVAEAVGTFFLVWAVVGVAVNPEALKAWAGLVIGGTLGLAVMVIAPLTGAGFNPARAFGPALVGDDGLDFIDLMIVYGLGPILGGLLAAGIYFYLFILPGQKGPGGMEPVG
jgi:MIP family channel proteins